MNSCDNIPQEENTGKKKRPWKCNPWEMIAFRLAANLGAVYSHVEKQQNYNRNLRSKIVLERVVYVLPVCSGGGNTTTVNL